VEVCEVAAGSTHSLALTATGTVFSFGRNSHGQLGEGLPASPAVRPPRPVAGLEGVACQRVAAGSYFSLVISAHGELWAFGSNAYGELGAAPSDAVCAPRRTWARDAPVCLAAGGHSHTLLLGLGGTCLYACGRNSHGQLGNPYRRVDSADADAGPASSKVNFEPDDGLPGTITHIACGRNHSVAVKGGVVYAWGCDDGGQTASPTRALARMGASGTSQQPAGGGYFWPAAAWAVENERWRRHQPYGQGTTAIVKVVQVAAGTYHTIALSDAGIAYGIGSGGLVPLDSEGVRIAAGGRTTLVVHAECPRRMRASVSISDLSESDLQMGGFVENHRGVVESGVSSTMELCVSVMG